MPFPYKNPTSPIQVLGTQSVDRSVVFGTHFSTNGTGGFMEVFSLSGLTYEIPAGQTGSIEYSGNTIPINFVKGTGAVYSPDVLILNSDNISSGRRKLGMLAYVYELDQVYQYDIPNYEQLWTAATASTNCVFINEFGTTVRNNTTEGRAFINAWTASTIEGVNGIVRANARWKKYWGNNLSVTGGSYNGLTTTLTLVNITGGTVDITGFGPGGGGGQFTAGTFSQPNLNITLTSTGGTLTITGVTGLYISGGSYSSGNTTLSLSNSTGGTITITGFSQTFSGGSGNCINQLYLNEIYPCTSDIKIQPLSAGKVYFGSSNAASGFTVDLVTDTSYDATRLGLNTNSPQFTFDFYARDRKNRLYFRDNLTGAGLVDIKNIIFSGDPDTNASFTVVSPDASGEQGAHGISIGVRGYTTDSSILNNGVGKTGDTFISAFADTNGLNILNGPGTFGANTEDYIRFYAGQLVNNNTPDIHIQGSGTTRGFVGINITGVTNQLHVSAVTNPVRFEGLQSSANTRYLVADSDGVVTYTTASPGGGGGDSITGGTYNQNNLNLLLVSTASTVTITGVTGLYISGGSYSSGNTTLSLSNSTGGTITITGFSQTFSGGSGNCINQLYLNEIYPCTSDIKIQPLSAGKVFFGSLSGASGFTVDLVSDTGYTTTRLGLNNSLPDYTIDFYSRDRKNRLYLLDNLTNIYSASNDAAYGPGQPARMIIVTTTGIDNSLAGTPITVYNSAGDSETRILNGVVTPSPSPGFSRLNFDGSLWAEDYRQAAGGYFVFPLSSGIGDSEIKNLIFSGKSDTNSSFSVTGPNRSELQGFHGISIGIRGYTTSGTALNNKVGVTGDSFIQVFPGTNGLNIINEVGTDTDNYIRFYAGQNFIDNTPDIHIQGSGATRGYVGINITGVTNQLHVSATTNPLRLEGLQQSALTRYLVADTNGVVYFTTGVTSGSSSSSSGFTTISITGTPQFTSTNSQTINFSGINISITSGVSNTLVFSASTGNTVTISGGTGIEVIGSYPNFGINFTGTTTGGTVSGDYLPLSGGTVTGGTVFQSGLTANTISATTYLNLPVSGLTEGNNISITGANGNFTISFTGTTGGGGFSAVSINNNFQFNATSSQTINFSGINISITSGISANTLIFSAATGLAGSGTTNFIAKWTGTTALTDSQIYDNGNIVVISGTTATIANSKLSVRGAIAAQGVQLSSKSGSIALVTSDYTSWGTGGSQIAIGDGGPLGNSTGTNNIAIGSASIKNAVTPSGNTAIGTETLNVLETGNYNVAIGYEAAKSINDTDEAVYIGYQAGMNGGSVGSNVVIGSQAAMSLSGANNVVIGKLAFGSKLIGAGNVAIGVGAGRESTGGGSVFIGYQAGYYSTGENKLYIHNSLGNPPLIYGEFDNLRLGIGTTAVTNTLHVSATTHPLRLEGLVSSANTRFLVANSDGVVTYTTSAFGGGGFSAVSINTIQQFDSSLSQTINFSGINISITSGISANTLIFSAGTGAPAITGGTFDPTNLELDITSSEGTVTISGVTGLYISAGTYSSGTTTLSLSNSTGGTISITGFSRTFSGGSGNCINQLYLNEIYPCTSDIKIQPLSAGKVFFGSLSGASGLTVDLVSDTVYETARLGLNTTLPEHTIDFYSRDRKNRLYLSDNLTNLYNFSNTYVIGSLAQFVISQIYDDVVSSWIGTSITLYNSSGDSVTKTLNSVFFNSPPGFTRLFFGGLWAQDYTLDAGGYFVASVNQGDGQNGTKNLIFSGDSDTRSSLTVSGPNRFGANGFHGISMGIRGYTTSGTVLNNQVGVTGDSFIQAFAGTNGLNIINEVGTGTDDYIRFYAGQNFINNVPDIHIQGSGTTRGFVGINVTGVTNTLHVSAATHPVRFEGLVSSANTRYLVANSDGVVTYTTSSPGGEGTGFSAITINNTSQFNSSSSQVLNFSGINITITSAATNTLVFSAGTGGGGGVTSITAGYGVSANTSTGNVTIIQVFDYGKAYTTGNNLNFL